ncbi:integrating conjugative element protein, PFL_4669 family [Pasteurella testudinis DSM 23072]|uniref:Integrating conjugative element protein, PFL_4669 family n=1 Tax=Pasteurella testudinis DSM 23072 TaxID=1122938 RepID=A0A1W1UMJ5_9PAST|nr:TIGR03761 family integrating conjugative element protein [Pasteurella testudinis]SMB82316.1 integrating conjugative element protein, PFL_4669 family [Pasteurella testudinis DSM 23072]SUB51490.1 integrating conjugative element protein, PFL family [Pasteurella testudinis]
MTDTQQQLGPLRSEITFTVHTQYASRLWQGRSVIKNDEGNITRSSILSMPNCLALITQIQRDAAQDDPYADDYLIKFEEKVLNHRQEMQELTKRLVSIYVDLVPENIQIERCANISPISYPIFVNSQLGYLLLYLLADFDTLARSTMTAAHIALMTREEAKEWLEEGAKLIRKCFGVVETYKHSGITRQDAAENNARYQSAVARMGYTLPPAILSGGQRANFAPYIRKPSVAEADIENDIVNQVETQISTAAVIDE